MVALSARALSPSLHHVVINPHTHSLFTSPPLTVYLLAPYLLCARASFFFCSEDSFVNDGPLSYVTDSSDGDEQEEDDQDGGGGEERGAKKRRRKGPKFENDEDEKVSGQGRGGGRLCVSMF